MNAWNQWGAAAAYPTPLPGYATPQTAAAPAIPGAAAGLPPVAAAAAVPYPAMPGFQAWPYAPAPQTMTPWAAATAGAANPAGQAAQWDQWNQWHQQYSQWQQQYAAQTAATTALSQQINSTTVSTPKVSMVPQVQTVAASTAPTLATNTTTTAAAISSHVKRPNEVPPESQPESKKSKTEQPAWSQATPSSTTSKELEELSEAEKQFDEQFKSWEAQFDAWRQQNASHPDTDQYKAYEAKWASWREQLLARREQMKKKREKLTEAASSLPAAASVKPAVETSDTTVNSVTSVPSILPPMYTGYTTPGITTSTTPSVSQYPSHYQQPQPQFMPAYLNPSAAAALPQASVAPPQISSQPPMVATTGGSEDSSSQQREFLKTSTSSGIPGLDLLSGSTAQGDTKTVPSVSFANSTQLPFQTPADNKPFDFPPPRQGPGFPGQNQTGQASSAASQQPPNAAAMSGGYPPGMIPPVSMQPPGFPPSFNNQPQPGGGFQGSSQSASYQGGFPGQTPPSGYQNQAPPSGGFPPSGPAPYQGPPTSGFQSTQAPPSSGFQAQAPSTGYQQPPSYGQPPPSSGFPSMGGYNVPPGPYPMSGFPQQGQDSSQQNFQNQQGQPGSFQDPSKGTNYPYQPQQNRPQFPPTSSAQDQSKKLPGLMDNVLGTEFSDRQTADSRGDNFPRGGRPDDNFQNKFADRFGDPGKDKFGEKPSGGPGTSARYGESQFSGKDASHSYNLPKPKGYFNLQEMSEEEEYEKFHEYQQSIENEEKDEDDRSRRSRPGDESRSSRYDHPSRFEDAGGPRFDDSGPRPRYDESRPRFEDNKPKYDGGRQPRFDGSKPSRFENASPNRFPPHSLPPPDKDKFKRSFENELSGPPPSMGNLPSTPSKSLRSTRWGASEPEGEPEPPRNAEERRFGGGLGPPFGATPDGLDFLFSVIIDYNHSPANLGVPDYFEPKSVIDYTHGNGIKIEESKEEWERMQRGSGKGPSPSQPWDRERDRGNFGDRRSPWKDDRSGDSRSGQYGSHGGSRGGPELSRGGPDLPRGGLDGSRGHDKPRDGPRSGPDVSRGDSEGLRSGQDDRSRSDRPRDSYRGGSDSQRDDRSRDRGSTGGSSSRWGDLDDRDRRRREEPSSDKRSKSPDRNRHSDRMPDRRDERRGDRKDSERDRRKRSRSPVVQKVEPPPPVAAPPPAAAVVREVVPVDDILQPPGREGRPSKIVIFMRGPPGSGKSFLAKMIKDKEVKYGGTAPRILSLDDYFMSDIEKEEVDPDSGRTLKKKVMEYEFEGAMEQKYRESLNKCFRKTITDGYFPFIIVDANNDKVSYFDSMINFCQIRGFTCYIIDLEQDLNLCLKRNIHKRSEKDIQSIINGYEETPATFKSLDVRSLLQEASIPEVDMEDSMDTVQSDETPDKPEIIEENKAPEEDKDKAQNQPADNKPKDNDKDVKAPERTGFARFTISSKWDDLDSTCSKLDRLDGFTSARKPRPTIQDWLQIPESETVPLSNPSVLGSKKRVRWADVEERSKQAKMKALGFVVGQTDWSRMMDPHSAVSKLTQTKYF